ncbi:hypothetical protein [Kitasatospora camelliae]|uniref:DUF4352 domain-containing protein n=1 Tax=Kitasatospora camelliae TaxID=3156397 RepID=A0AAU8JUQ4_9ACTN
MRIHTARVTVAALAAAVALTATACEPEDGANGTTATTAATAAATGAAPASASPAGGTATGAAGTETKKQQKYKYGEPATVDFANDKKQTGTLRVTVTGIETGSLDELRAAKIPVDGLDGKTPVYVSYTMTNTSDVDFSFTAPDTKFMVMNTTAKAVANIPSAATPLEKCKSASTLGFKKGVEIKGCFIGAVPNGAKPSFVAFMNPTVSNQMQVYWQA